MRIARIGLLVVLGLCACRGREASRIGRPGDPGFVGEQALGSSAAHAGPIEGDFVGSIFHVSYYQQPDDLPPVIGLEYGAYDAEHGDYWLHVSLWGREQLPADVDIATYSGGDADGVPQPARVEFAHTLARGADLQDLRHASAGRLQLELEAGHAALELTDLGWADDDAADPIGVTHGQAEGDVVYRCYLHAAETAEPHLTPESGDLTPIPNPDLPEVVYVEDLELSSKFCSTQLRQASGTR
jgi:hypothetical protein